jgi:hypothetical protein
VFTGVHVSEKVYKIKISNHTLGIVSHNGVTAINIITCTFMDIFNVIKTYTPGGIGYFGTFKWDTTRIVVIPFL